MEAPCKNCTRRKPGTACHDNCCAFEMYKRAKAAEKKKEMEYATSFPLSWRSRDMFRYKRDRRGKMRTVTK